MTERDERIQSILKTMVEKATPAVARIVDGNDSGSIEFHFGQGKYKTARAILTL